MPDRWASRCSTVTRSSISGRSSPSNDRAVVSRRISSRSTIVMSVRAVSPFAPLATANCVSAVFGTPSPRWAIPVEHSNTTTPARSTRTVPESPSSVTIRSIASPSPCASWSTCCTPCSVPHRARAVVVDYAPFTRRTSTRRCARVVGDEREPLRHVAAGVRIAPRLAVPARARRCVADVPRHRGAFGRDGRCPARTGRRRR